MAKKTNKPVTALDKAFARYKIKTGYKRLSKKQKAYVMALPATQKAVGQEILGMRLESDRKKLADSWNKEAEAINKGQEKPVIELLDPPKPQPKAKAQPKEKKEKEPIILESMRLTYGIGKTSKWEPQVADFLEMTAELNDGPNKSSKTWSFDGVLYTQKEVTKILQEIIKELFKEERFRSDTKLGYSFEKAADLSVLEKEENGKRIWQVLFDLQ